MGRSSSLLSNNSGGIGGRETSYVDMIHVNKVHLIEGRLINYFMGKAKEGKGVVSKVWNRLVSMDNDYKEIEKEVKVLAIGGEKGEDLEVKKERIVIRKERVKNEGFMVDYWFRADIQSALNTFIIDNPDLCKAT